MREYTFPDVSQILRSRTVYLAMEEAWGQMVRQVSSKTGRREYVFYLLQT